MARTLSTLGITDDPAQTFAFLLDAAIPDVQLQLPVAGVEALWSTENLAQWLEESLGLPPGIFSPVTSGAEGVSVLVGVYSVGFGDPGDIGVKRNGGLRIDVNANITGLVQDALFVFEIEPFSFLENTDPATLLIPNFRAHASVAQLSIPGLPAGSQLLSLSNFNLELVKDADGLSLFLDGDAFILGAAFTADAEFQLNEQGIYGGALLTANGGAFSLGLDFSGEFSLEINTTNQTQTITRTTFGFPVDIDMEPGLRIHVEGSLDILNSLTLDGKFDLAVDAGQAVVAIEATVTIFGQTLRIEGTAGLYFDANPGIAFSLRLKLGLDDTPTVVVVPNLFAITGALQLEINTTGVTRFDLISGTAIGTGLRIVATDLSVNLAGIVLSGSLIIDISSAGLSITVPASNPLSLSFFGLVNMSVSGSLNTNGQFSFNASAGMTVGNPSVFGFSGSIFVGFSNNGFSGGISGTFGAFGIQISAGGSFFIESGLVKVEVFISLQITPAFSFKVWTPWKTYTVHVPAVVISGTWSYTFGALTTVPVPPPPPILATALGNTLRLNIGADVVHRGPDYPVQDESYAITVLGTGSSGVGQRLNVNALGYDQEYDNITHIVANDTQARNNFISTNSAVAATVSVNAGKTVTGQNRYFLGGSGAAFVQGGSAQTTVEFSGANSTYVGGPGPSQIEDKSGGLLTATAPGFAHYLLTDGSLTYDNGGAIYIMTFEGDSVNNVVLAGSANATYETTSLGNPALGIPADPWTGNATFNGTGTSSRIRATTAGDLTLTNSVLTESGVSIALNNILDADLHGNEASNTFEVSGWTGSGNLTGNGGTDTVVATNDVDFTLSDSSLGRSGQPALALSSIEIANLTGGSSANTFSVSDWTGVANLDGVGDGDTYTVDVVGSGSGTVTILDTGGTGGDTLTVNGTAAADPFTISGTQVLVASETINYANLEALTVNGHGGDDSFLVLNTSIPTTVNGGDNNDSFAVNSSTAELTLNGGADNDTFNIGSLASVTTNTGGTLNLIAAALTINGEGAGDSDTLNLDDTGDSIANTGTLTGTTLTGLGMSAAGLTYSGLETLNLNLGSGSDVLNIRGTTAVTNLSANNGDDRVYVSSLADESTATASTDFLRGNLDQILGILNLDLGAGRHLLMISDESATVGDGTVASPARITDQAVAGLGLPPTEIAITGLTPAPAITYQAAPGGDFADGITIWTGWGADAIHIDGTHQRGSVRTVTTLNTGLGDDTVTVDLNAADGFFVLNTQGPENGFVGVLSDRDTVNASSSTRPLIIFGGQDDDAIHGGQAADIIFGDRGLVTYYNGATPVAVFGNGGPGDLTDGVERALGFVTTTSPDVGGNDTIDALNGNNVVFGGFANDSITTGSGADVSVGDNGSATFDPVSLGLANVTTSDPTYGGIDLITAGDGNNIALGGSAGDTITTGIHDDIALGDNGYIDFVVADQNVADIDIIASTDFAIGDVDIITTSEGSDIVFGGQAADTINAGNGHNIVFGDNAELISAVADAANFSTQPVTLGRLITVAPGVGGIDNITTGVGRDIVLGGPAGDTIVANAGESVSNPDESNLILGDDGVIDYVRFERDGATPGADTDASDIDLIESLSTTSAGGVDAITTGAGNDLIIGGRFGDTIGAGAGNNLVVGDSARVTAANEDGHRFSSQPITAITVGRIETIAFGDGGVDLITTLGGHDVVVGGHEGDIIVAGEGNNLVVGDDGAIDYVRVERDGATPGADTDASDIDLIESLSMTFAGGEDNITTGTGNDLIVGGRFADTIDADRGNNLVLSDSGRITAADANSSRFGSGPLTLVTFGRIETIEPGDGGADEVTTGVGRDIVLGGPAGDTIVANAGETVSNPDGANLILGDDGYIDFVRAEREPAALGGDTNPGDIDVIASTDFADGGVDAITTGVSNDVVVGGQSGDVIVGGTGDNLVVGDSGIITAATEDLNRYAGQSLTLGRIETVAFGIGGADSITLGEGNDVVLGGHVDDTINAGDGDNVVLGDDGAIEYVRLERSVPTPGADLNALDIDLITSLSTAFAGGSDSITTGSGNDIIIGGRAGDTILTGDGNNIAIGDSGVITAADEDSPRFGNQPMTVGRIETITTGDGGIDTIRGGAGEDILLGGATVDWIDGGAGDDLITGDNAVLDRTPRVGNFTSPLFQMLAGTLIYDDQDNWLVDGVPRNQPGGAPVWGDLTLTLLDHSFAEQALPGSTKFGDDYIAGGADNDRIFGGLGDDIIQGDSSIDILVSAGRLPDGTLVVVPSFEAATDGDDYIEGNGGNDLIFGGLRQDDIIGGSSEFFGLTTRELRPDGADLIFGGAGTDIEHNDFGDTTDTGHAHDSDTILGDNGNISRLVGTNTLPSDPYGYLSFNYDDYGSEKIIPRAVAPLDYTPGGMDFDAVNAASDIGAADEIHGEAGDDTIYGLVGDDVIFGEGQDDDLIGGYGHDWIAGGTGQDGVLGDDGRIYTSRNDGNAETLYGIAGFAQNQLDVGIKTPGEFQQAIINVSGALKKTVNLTPFNADSSDDPLYDAQDADDIIYGGLGNDFLHGGSGDDAISGAEALSQFYVVPLNPGDVLGWGNLAKHNRVGEFAAYSEYDPQRKILVDGDGVFTEDGTGDEFILNFDALDSSAPLDTHSLGTGFGQLPTDGDDVLFGDLGNDWLVGGTGRDNLYGGWGDDLLNADDNHDTTADTADARANNVPDTHPSYEDRAYGGAGRDILLANTGGDRLIDWAGEFNSYLVPFAPFGLATISRALQPQIPEFLYDLSASDGADPTRAADTGSDPARNGEPDGELGLVKQSDSAWQDQTGAPDDPQPGNISGGARDVLRGASFSNGKADGFAAEKGNRVVENGRFAVEPEFLGGDAVSVFYVDAVRPSYFEMLATISAKTQAGYSTNAYLIFDYQSETDFKFAGINPAINKLEIGHRDADGWQVDAQSNMQLSSDQDYNIILAIHASTVTMVVDNDNVLTHVFAPRVIDGYSYGLNTGMVGIGADNSTAGVDNVTVQILPTEITLELSDGFAGSGDSITMVERLVLVEICVE